MDILYNYFNNIKHKSGKKKQILENCLKFCEKTNISKKNIGNYIRAIHLTLPSIITIAICFSPFIYAIFSFILLLLIFSAFVYYNGCLLSYLETHLCNDDFNMVDIFLELDNLKITYKNRFYLTLYVAIYSVLFFILVLLTRFYY